MRIDIVTIFPEYFSGPLDAALLGKARAKGLLDIRVHDLRAHTTDNHRTVDDEPFGGGPGMVMKPEPWFEAVEAINGWERARRVLLTPAAAVRGMTVPDVLLSGDHAAIERWRREQATERTKQRRPDLLDG